MSEGTVAIVGSGIVGTTMAHLLTRKGYDVDVFEKGPEYPYPHLPQFREQVLYLHDNPAYRLPTDLQNLTVSGNYPNDPNGERAMVVGGAATVWGAVTLRLAPHDFNTRSRYGYGEDWPLAYDELEPYYCDAERLLGVSGTDADNPFAPRRSRPYPLPPFALSYDDRMLADRLRQRGIVLHTTPQARTRLPYEQRPGCMNFGTCSVCPIGVRYSPNYHLAQAVGTGRCRVHANTSVRRILLERSGRARALVHRPNGAAADMEHAAKVIVVAAGAVESARLLLLSASDQDVAGLAPGGHLGRHLLFHHVWSGIIHYRDELQPGTVGARTAQCHQYVDPPGRGKHGGVKVEFSSHVSLFPFVFGGDRSGPETVDQLKETRHQRLIVLHAESAPSAQKYVVLSDKRDRFGDPFAHVHYQSANFDYESHRFARQIFDRFVAATGGDHAELHGADTFDNGHHHMGTCRMGVDARDSVVDRFGKVHGTPNLFAVGGSNFPSTGPVNPTLTMVALGIRAAGHIVDRAL